MNKEEIKNLIINVRKLDGVFECRYIPEEMLYSIENLHDLYYGGACKIHVGMWYSDHKTHEDIDNNEDNLDYIVEKFYNCLQTDIREYINNALTNLKLEGEALKYFDSDPELYKEFKNEVLRLKNIK